MIGKGPVKCVNFGSKPHPWVFFSHESNYFKTRGPPYNLAKNVFLENLHTNPIFEKQTLGVFFNECHFFTRPCPLDHEPCSVDTNKMWRFEALKLLPSSSRDIRVADLVFSGQVNQHTKSRRGSDSLAVYSGQMGGGHFHGGTWYRIINGIVRK